MSVETRLVIFDVDGTLVDSQADILGAMNSAFEALCIPAPSRDEILGIVGLSLDVAMLRLVPAASAQDRAALVEGYKSAYVDMRAKVGAAQSSPLYPGAIEVLDHLRSLPDVWLGVATGKSKRGLDKLIEAHGLEGYFTTQQVADFHPSKPHPSMIFQAMEDVGVTPQNTAMIGDTSFDMEMAAAAGVHGLGVSWGYHPASSLAQAKTLVNEFGAVPQALSDMWKNAS